MTENVTSDDLHDPKIDFSVSHVIWLIKCDKSETNLK